MGMFDSVWAKCPSCGQEHEFQSKSGDCILGNYTFENAPDDVMINVNRHSPVDCDCGTLFEIDIENRKPVISKKIIYIGSPYSHPDKDIRIKRFELVSKFAAELVSQGHIAISPITYGHVLLDYKNMPTDFEFWNNFCIGLLKKSDYLYVLKIDGCNESIGLKEEIKFAKENNIKIKYIEI
jgi:hypothetical protein